MQWDEIKITFSSMIVEKGSRKKWVFRELTGEKILNYNSPRKKKKKSLIFSNNHGKISWILPKVTATNVDFHNSVILSTALSNLPQNGIPVYMRWDDDKDPIQLKTKGYNIRKKWLCECFSEDDFTHILRKKDFFQ